MLSLALRSTPCWKNSLNVVNLGLVDSKQKSNEIDNQLDNLSRLNLEARNAKSIQNFDFKNLHKLFIVAADETNRARILKALYFPGMSDRLPI